MQQLKNAVIADDDKETLRDLVQILEAENFNVALALDTQHAIQLINKFRPLLIISEVADRNYDGISLFKYLEDGANSYNNIGSKIIALTSNMEEQNEVLSYESGVDLYLRKPLRKSAFRKRLLKCFAESAGDYRLNPTDEYEIKDLYFDIKKRMLFKMPNKELMNLQSKSFEILLFLSRFPNQVFSRVEIMQAIWGDVSKVTLRTIDIHILKIRQLLGKGYVKTIKGVGYLFEENI